MVFLASLSSLTGRPEISELLKKIRLANSALITFESETRDLLQFIVKPIS